MPAQAGTQAGLGSRPARAGSRLASGGAGGMGRDCGSRRPRPCRSLRRSCRRKGRHPGRAWIPTCVGRSGGVAAIGAGRSAPTSPLMPALDPASCPGLDPDLRREEREGWAEIAAAGGRDPVDPLRRSCRRRPAPSPGLDPDLRRDERRGGRWRTEPGGWQPTGWFRRAEANGASAGVTRAGASWRRPSRSPARRPGSRSRPPRRGLRPARRRDGRRRAWPGAPGGRTRSRGRS